MMSNQLFLSIYQVIIKLVQCLCLRITTYKNLYGEILFDDNFHKIKTKPGRNDDDFNNAKMYKIYNV